MLAGYRQPPYVTAHRVDALDVATSDGVASRYNIAKPIANLNSIIQVGNTFPNAASGGFAKVTGPDGVLLTSAPTLGTKIIMPGIVRFTFKAYGQSSVQGLSNPNISQTVIHLVDPDDIATYLYLPSVGQSHMRLSFVDNDTTYGAQTGWLQFGYGTPASILANDATGTTFGTAGASINLEDISGLSTLATGASSGATSFTVVDGSQFSISPTATTIQFDTGLSTEETVQLMNISGNVLTTTPTTYAHSSGAYVYHNGLLLWGQLTLPTNLTGFANYYDVSIDLLADYMQR